MGQDYYEILEVYRDCQSQDIAQAYRKLALRYHPKLSKLDSNTTYHYFCNISEAYEVLSDPVKRAFYDKYGEEKLKEGFFSQGELLGGYRFGGNPEEIFEKFFGTNNAYSQIYDSDCKEEFGSLFSHAFGAQNFRGVEPPQDLMISVDCTLNELYNGCIKKIKYQRIILNNDGRTTRIQDEVKDLEIKAGLQSDAKIIFEKMGNEAAGQDTSKLIFQIREVKHNQFKRKGNDLIYVAKISLYQALNSSSIELITLDNRKLFVSMDEVISPKTVKLVEGEGFPVYDPSKINVQTFNRPSKKGNLFVKFDIQFPSQIPEDSKQYLSLLFPEDSNDQ